MLTIDGAQGEGGGQVLRSSLTLAVLSGQAVRIENIRAGRRKPGLAAQHLAAVQAAAAISAARVEGAEMGAATLVFRPGPVQPGAYRFDIGTAGAAALVLQTLFLPLSLAAQASTVTIGGGTHVPWSPPFDYLQQVWLPVLQRIGCDASLHLDQAGFYPRGGGQIRATIRPARALQPLDLTSRGALRGVSVLSTVANLAQSIAERQARRAAQRLNARTPRLAVQTRNLPAPSPGTALFLRAESEGGAAGFSALGARGKPAEQVADEAVDALLAYLQTQSAVDPHLADQLLLPLALVPGVSRFSASKITPHLLTNVAVVQTFLPVQIRVDGALGQPGLVEIRPGAARPASTPHPIDA